MAATPLKKNLSALKRDRQNEKLNLRNKAVRTRIKGIVKKLRASVVENDKEAVAGGLAEAEKVISSAASKGVLHRNTASRKISRLTKLAHTVLAPKPEAA